MPRRTATLSMLALALGTLGAGAASAVPLACEQPAEQEPSPLLGVRFFASPENLDRIERIAREVGWTRSLRDIPGSILLLAPEPYRFELFEALMNAILPLRLPDAIQLIGRDGRPIGP